MEGHYRTQPAAASVVVIVIVAAAVVVVWSSSIHSYGYCKNKIALGSPAPPGGQVWVYGVRGGVGWGGRRQSAISVTQCGPCRQFRVN